MASNEELSIFIRTQAEQTNSKVEELIKNLKSTGAQIKYIKSIAKDGILDKTIISATNGIKQMNYQLDKTGNVIKQTEKVVNSSKKSISSMFDSGKLYLYWNLTKRIRTSMSNVIKSAVDYNETVNLFNVSMGKDGVQAADRFQNKLSEAFATARTELMKYQATFKNILSGLGNLSNETTVQLSESLVKMGLDYSSLFNISQESAMSKLQAALTGSIRPIRSDSGYDVSDSTIAAKAQELGVDKTSRELNQVEKRLLRIIVLMEQLKNTGAFQDLSRTINEPANQLKILKNQLQEIGVWLGNVFIGVLGKVLPYVNGFLMVIKELIKMFAIFVGYEAPSTGLVDILQESSEGAGGIASGLGSAAKAAKEMRKYLMGFDVLNVIQTPTESPKGGGGSGGVGGIDPKILNAMKEYDSIMEGVRNKATEIRDRIMAWLGFTKLTNEETGEVSWKLQDGYTNLEKIRDAIIIIAAIVTGLKIFSIIQSIAALLQTISSSSIVVWFTNLTKAFSGAAAGSAAAKSALVLMIAPIAKVIAIVTLVVGAITAFTKAIQELWQENEDFRNSVTELWTNVADTIRTVYESLIAPIIGAFKSGLDEIKYNGLLPLWESFKEALASIVEAFNNLYKEAKPIIDFLIITLGTTLGVAITGAVAVITGIINTVLGLITTAVRSISGMVSSIITVFQGVIQFVTGVFTGNWSKAFDGLKNIVVGTAGFIGNTLKALINTVISIINGIISMINVFIRSLNKLKVPDWVPNVGGKGINIPIISKVKYLAEGGTPDIGEMFVAREAGPELVGRIGSSNAVMNNDQIVESVSRGVAQAVSAVMGNGGASYNLYLDGKQLTDVVQERIYRNAIISGA